MNTLILRSACVGVICLISSVYLLIAQTVHQDAIYSGVPWFDEAGKTVSAHGACMIKEDGRYYLFGEYKTDSANVFNGFVCYSSTDLYSWKFERMALPVQRQGKLGSKRVGERPKVMKSRETGKYVMYMHVDSINYKDQFVGYATADEITGPYTFQGPLLYKGQPIRKWDIGAFQDKDGTGYLLVHHGDIYELNDDFCSVKEKVASDIPGVGESPAMLCKDGRYYLLSSNLTSWERNDNHYHTATSIRGPWIKKGYFAPAGTLTWNSQCSFIFQIDGTDETTYMYMGDRWSFPKQNSAATYVWQPLQVGEAELSIPTFADGWTIDLKTGKTSAAQNSFQTYAINELPDTHFNGMWKNDTLFVRGSSQKDDYFSFAFTGRRVSLFGFSRPDGGYAEVSIVDRKGTIVNRAVIDMYCLYANAGLKFVSPWLTKGDYTLIVRVLGQRGNWSDKRRNNYGSIGYVVSLEKVLVEP
ncbi:family 43 glycosylhydrolase [Sphingobacterium suaedae]|uniref:Family 43 glycosylhydrolase n=1 Tax=Sphingobacterium suaedae TaxID=1686402 RepID=A0ABW5KC77_9SPHI